MKPWKHWSKQARNNLAFVLSLTITTPPAVLVLLALYAPQHLPVSIQEQIAPLTGAKTIYLDPVDIVSIVEPQTILIPTSWVDGDTRAIVTGEFHVRDVDILFVEGYGELVSDLEGIAIASFPIEDTDGDGLLELRSNNLDNGVHMFDLTKVDGEPGDYMLQETLMKTSPEYRSMVNCDTYCELWVETSAGTTKGAGNLDELPIADYI